MISNSQGYLNMKEVYNFSQMDLNVNDVMVLDAYSTIFMWMGPKANKVEIEKSASKCEKYVQSLTDGRVPEKIQLVPIDPGSEPNNFRAFFPEWEDEVTETWFQLDPYAAAMAKLEAEKAASAQAKWGTQTSKDFSDPTKQKFDIEVLRKGCPEGVQPDKKESYLSDEQFQEVFGCNQEAFEQLKPWKQKDIKKAKGLF